MEDNRELSKNIIGKYLNNQKNIITFEKLIYNLTKDKPSMYRVYIFQLCLILSNRERIFSVINDEKISEGISRGKDKMRIKDILDIIKQDKLGFNHEGFKNERILQEEYDEYLVNPFEVVKGLLKCPKCKSDKTMSYSKNDRSSDEPMSVYATCFMCKFNWRENN